MRAMSAKDLIGKPVVAKHWTGKEIHGRLIAIADEPTFVLVDANGRPRSFSESTIDEMRPA